MAEFVRFQEHKRSIRVSGTISLETRISSPSLLLASKKGEHIVALDRHGYRVLRIDWTWGLQENGFGTALGDTDVELEHVDARWNVLYYDTKGPASSAIQDNGAELEGLRHRGHSLPCEASTVGGCDGYSFHLSKVVDTVCS
jgi:hypothetical protein